MKCHKREPLPVLSSIEPVIAQGRWVEFHPEHVGTVVAQWMKTVVEPSEWGHPCHFFDGTEETVRWIFVLDVLNHCFWPRKGEPLWAVTYKGVSCSGYWGLAAALKHAMDRGIPITNAAFLSQMSANELSQILSGQGIIPLFEERLHNLRETGRILQAQCGGDVVRLIGGAEGSAVRAVGNIVSSFPSFRDEAIYRGRRVHFWKRAQLVVGDIHLAFSGKEWGDFFDIDCLTAFADYKLPQVLRELGVISYHRDLSRVVDQMEELAPGSEQEVEIRAMTILAVEEIKKALAMAGENVTSSELDNWLWHLGQLEPYRKKPYHRCRTIFY